MTTSLQAQLKLLAAPQTTGLADAKKKASILFDPKDAATKDRKIIYEIGLNGLQELCVINPNFRNFERTLFDVATVNFERAVENEEVNLLLNQNIKKFLYHLSPHFLLRPAHLCIEWMLRRFHVHEYNIDELMALALPYHETNVFVRVLQTIRFRKSHKESEWTWLRPLQKAGVHLSKLAIINRAASQPSFYEFICKTTTEAVRELGSCAIGLQTQIGFYTTIIIGVLETTKVVKEFHVTSLLPSLLAGFKSEIVDFAAASLMISAQLSSRTKLMAKLCIAFIERATAINFERLQRSICLLLICMFNTQTELKLSFSEITIQSFLRNKWMTKELGRLSEQNIAVDKLCLSLVQTAIKMIQQQNTDSKALKNFLDQLIFDITFTESAAQLLINCILDSYVESKNINSKLSDGEIIELDSDDDDTNVDDDFCAWYSNYLGKLENQYPEAFDLCIKKSLGSKKELSENRNKALKLAIGYRLKNFDENSKNIYTSLYHHISKIRLCAVQKLIKDLDKYQSRPQNYHILKECLADRIADESELIVSAVLKLSTKDFLDILGYDLFVSELFQILYKIQFDPDNWGYLTKDVIKHLTSQEIIEKKNTNLILLTLMPLMFPNNIYPDAVHHILAIIKSPLSEKIEFLKEFNTESLMTQKNINASDLKTMFLDVISNSKKMPKVQELLEIIISQPEKVFNRADQFTHFLILMTASFKNQVIASESILIFEKILEYTNRFKLQLYDNNKKQNFDYHLHIPLQLFSDFLIKLIMHTAFVDMYNFEEPSQSLKLFLQIFEYVTTKVFCVNDNLEKQEWMKILRDTFNIAFKLPSNKINFLINFYVYDDLKIVKNFDVLRLMAFKILNKILSSNKLKKNKISAINIFKISVALISKSETIRMQCLETLNTILTTGNIIEKMKYLITSILDRSLEINMDEEQFPLILFTILKPKKTLKTKQVMADSILSDILKFLNEKNALDNGILVAQLLKILKHINNSEILGDLMSLASNSLDLRQKEGAVMVLKHPYSLIFELICERFSAETIGDLFIEKQNSWQLIVKIFNMQHTLVNSQNKMQPTPCLFLEALDEDSFAKLPAKYKIELTKLIIKSAAASQSDTILLTANKFLKKCHLDCESFTDIISKMFKNQKKQTKNNMQGYVSQFNVNSPEWKEGVALLEFLENRKNLINSIKIIPILFDLLTFCLIIEDKSVVEYVKQLTLSTILHCCQYSKLEGIDISTALSESTFRIDQVVECVRATQNPQTQHNALLLLAYCADFFPQQVLHNIVGIFTFMGSSVVRHDDAFSFHIINTTIETIIPIIVKKNNYGREGADNVTTLVVPVLKIFSDIILDIPEHRRLPLYTKLLYTVGADEFLWIFLCIVFESYVIEDEKAQMLQSKNADQRKITVVSKRLEIIAELIYTFVAPTIIETCTQLLNHIKSLPMQKESDNIKKNSSETLIFDIKCHSNKQLRHYKYIIVQFISTITSSNEFLQKISSLSDENQLAMKSYYQNFIIKTLSYVPIVNNSIEKNEENKYKKFYRVMLHNLHNILDNGISLLSPDMFLIVVNGLMQHQMLSMKRKVIDLLIVKLQQKDDYFQTCDEVNFYNLLEPLTNIIDTIFLENENISQTGELVSIQQNAIMVVKLLSKLLALKYMNDFKNLLTKLIKIIKNRKKISKSILATTILAIIEITSNLKAYALPQLPIFMPAMLEILKDQSELVSHKPPENICIAVITGIYKLFEALPLFLGPYIVEILISISKIYTQISLKQNEKDQRITVTMNRISSIWTKISTVVPMRLLIPNCDQTYKLLKSSKNYGDIKALFTLVHQSINNATYEDLNYVKNDLNNFLLQSLEFRFQVKNDEIDAEIVDSTECKIIETFISWILKLSENAFRPIFYKVHNWALKDKPQKETYLTYFLFTQKVSENLKGLFLLFAGDLLEDGTNLLNKCNSSQNNFTDYISTDGHKLINCILNTFLNIFLHDNKQFINSQRFEIIAQPIIDQFENSLVLEDEELQKILISCIAQLAVTISNDVLCKQLNNRILLKTRTNVPETRINSFKCCVEIARKLGDDFLSLLPDTIPFIAELLEDENARVEKNTRKLVQELEQILGESLQKYL